MLFYIHNKIGMTSFLGSTNIRAMQTGNADRILIKDFTLDTIIFLTRGRLVYMKELSLPRNNNYRY